MCNPSLIMVIYEVNVTVDGAVAASYLEFMGPHMKEVLESPGFVSAQLFERDAKAEGHPHFYPIRLFTIHYQVKDRPSLDRYLEERAPALRKDVQERFGDRARFQRRILTQVSIE